MAASAWLIGGGTVVGGPVGAGVVRSHSGGVFGWALARIAGVPIGGSAPARLEIRGSDRGDVWTRTFGRRRQVSVVRLVERGVEERFGRLVLDFSMSGGGTELRLRRSRLGPLALGRRWFALRCVTARGDGRVWCRVDATLLGGQLGWLHYEIHLREDSEGDPR